jgi:hypothetical protein
MLLLTFFVDSAFSQDTADCTACHRTNPVTTPHPRAEPVSVANCMICHSNDANDALFMSLHKTHPELGMSCDSCHGDLNRADRDARLKAIQSNVPK